MKRLLALLSLAAALASCPEALAEPRQTAGLPSRAGNFSLLKEGDGDPELIGHFGISGSPLSAASYFEPGYSSYSGYGTLSYIYKNSWGPSMTTGTFIAGLDVKFNKVIAVTADLGLNVIWADEFSGVTSEKVGTRTGIAVSFVPKAKIYYMDKPLVRLYGTVGLGIGKYFGYPTRSSSNLKNPFKFETQLVPFGIEVGRKVFGFAEVGFGTMFVGVHAGAGYKF